MNKEIVRDVVGVLGILMLGYGLYLVFPPAAFIGVGSILTVFAAKGL